MVGKVMRYWLLLCMPSSMHVGCGSDAGSSKSAEIDAPRIENTTERGLVFAALSIDQSIGNSSIFRYDFKAGKITKILIGESSNPALFLMGSQVILFNRHHNLKNYKQFDPFADEIIPKAGDHSLATGDPTDVLDLGSDQLLLASPQGKSLHSLNTKLGTIQPLTFNQGFASKSFRPYEFQRTGQKLYVIHSGMELSPDGQGSGDGTQQLYEGIINGNSIEFRDLNPQTNFIDGTPLTATFPTYSTIPQNDQFKVLGLCSKQIQNCQAGLDVIQKGMATKISSYGADGAQYVDQIQPSEQADRLWGLVSDAQDAYVVGQIDSTKGTITEVLHRFTQKRIFGVKFEPESQTMFVGDTDGEKGKLLVYRGRQKIASIDIDGVFYRGVFVK